MEFRALIVPKTTLKYVLYGSHNSLCHNGTTRLYKFLKRQYYWKTLKDSVKNFVRHYLQCQKKFTDTKLCAILFKNTPDSNEF